MTTERKYFCNVCRDEITMAKDGVGFLFKSGDTEFESGPLNKCENHLCMKCINAIYDLSVRIHSSDK